MTVNFARFPIPVISGNEIDYIFDTASGASEGGITASRARRSRAIRNYHVGIPPDYVQEVRNLYLSHDTTYPLALLDLASDNTFTDQVLTYSTTGGTTTALLSKTYQPATGARTYSERILIPDTSRVALTVKVDGTPTSFTLADFGKIELADVGSATVTASGEFLRACCFMEDALTLAVHETKGPLLAIDKVALREILEAELIFRTA